MRAIRVLLSGIVLRAFSVATSVLAQESASQQLGTIELEVRGSPEVREHVVRGVKLVHHVMYPEADRAFAAAAAADPTCAFPYWGRAMTIIHPLWPDAPSEEERQVGEGRIRRGLACLSLSPAERAYLETLDGYFGSTENLTYAYLQRCQYDEADTICERLASLTAALELRRRAPVIL